MSSPSFLGAWDIYASSLPRRSCSSVMALAESFLRRNTAAISSKDFPFVSGTLKYANRKKMRSRPAKIANTYGPHRSCSGRVGTGETTISTTGMASPSYPWWLRCPASLGDGNLGGTFTSWWTALGAQQWGHASCLFVWFKGFLTAMYWKHIPTMKLQAQLQKPATAMAAGRGPWLNSSATINQGMGPGPTSKKMTKRKIATMLT